MKLTSQVTVSDEDFRETAQRFVEMLIDPESTITDLDQAVVNGIRAAKKFYLELDEIGYNDFTS